LAKWHVAVFALIVLVSVAPMQVVAEDTTYTPFIPALNYHIAHWDLDLGQSVNYTVTVLTGDQVRTFVCATSVLILWLDDITSVPTAYHVSIVESGTPHSAIFTAPSAATWHLVVFNLNDTDYVEVQLQMESTEDFLTTWTLPTTSTSTTTTTTTTVEDVDLVIPMLWLGNITMAAIAVLGIFQVAVRQRNYDSEAHI